MTAIQDATKLLQTLPELTEVYERNLPKEAIDNTSINIARVDSVNKTYGTAGNLDVYSVDTQIEIQVYYADTFGDFDAFEAKLVHLFKNAYWGITSPSTQSTDPDTYQVTSTFYFTETQYI